MMQSLVSIIIPTYGRPERLIESINSVLNQTYVDCEIIVVDDNNPATESRLETEALMERFSENTNLHYIKHERNKNGSAARNTGFKKSKGEYICFLDDDDIFFQNKVENQVKYLLEHQNKAAVYTGYRTNNIDFIQEFYGNLSMELLLLEYTPVTSSIMFRRDAINQLNGFDESFQRHQDYELMLRFFNKFEIGVIRTVLLEFGVNDGSNRKYGVDLENLKYKFIKTFENEIEIINIDNPGFKKRVISRHMTSVFVSHINHGFYLLAVKLFPKLLRNSITLLIKDLLWYINKYIKFHNSKN